jgi:hypothetical protein
MTQLAILYLLVGLLSYWPAVYFWLDPEEIKNGRWYHWLMAWIMWCFCWPYRYIMNAWYWWRATK